MNFIWHMIIFNIFLHIVLLPLLKRFYVTQEDYERGEKFMEHWFARKKIQSQIIVFNPDKKDKNI